MKPVILAAFGLFVAQLAYGQNTEYSVHLNSGGFAYRGKGAAASSIVLVPDIYPGSSYTNNPYGKNLGFSYGLVGQMQRVRPKRSLFGVQAGYEVLRSRVDVTEILAFRLQTPASGHTTLASRTINLHPFFGHRLASQTIDFDLTAGPDLGFILSAREEIDTIAQGEKFSTKNTRADAYLELRARLNVAAYYKHFGVTAGYSRGLTNNYGLALGIDGETYSQFFRLGLAYRL
ncbi:outer membrane beta-barrel protein [Hymenobacter norwichensis]|uniref:outer membrane beta-barrel protein n=1 Tax=Hymenobacter norwichensis TaxID=223903 RepID=UPI0003B623E0|nr:outer membrane beta-barrel protein [Hymenobacter norwichensis]